MYEVRKWRDGHGIWKRVFVFSWRVKGVGPFGEDIPWHVEDLAIQFAASLERSRKKWKFSL